MAPPFWQETGRGLPPGRAASPLLRYRVESPLGMRREIERVLATMRAR
jgi:hypothetical protein